MDTEGVILGHHRHKESLFGNHGQLDMDGYHLALPFITLSFTEIMFFFYILIETNPNFYFCSLS